MSDEIGGNKKLDEGELDMTPMIDVTFLLLIFFMIASLSLIHISEPTRPY